MGGEVEISNYIPASYVTSFLQGVGGKESNSALKGKKKNNSACTTVRTEY